MFGIYHYEGTLKPNTCHPELVSASVAKAIRIISVFFNILKNKMPDTSEVPGIY
jgi:hypothetical protein